MRDLKMLWQMVFYWLLSDCYKTYKGFWRETMNFLNFEDVAIKEKTQASGPHRVKCSSPRHLFQIHLHIKEIRAFATPKSYKSRFCDSILVLSLPKAIQKKRRNLTSHFLLKKQCLSEPAIIFQCPGNLLISFLVPFLNFFYCQDKQSQNWYVLQNCIQA